MSEGPHDGAGAARGAADGRGRPPAGPDPHPAPGSTGGDRAQRLAVAGLGFILLVTAAWWALALWPVPGETPGWLARARAACFGTTETGLPDASGWVLLIGQPIGMVGVLLAGWGRATLRGLTALAGSTPGRSALVATSVALLLGLGAAGVRVSSAASAARFELDGGLPPATYPRLDEVPAPLSLTDHRGERFALDRLRGRPVLVTFAFAHCETICPLLVRDALEIQRRARVEAGAEPALVVVTVDPWRDTPARLPSIAERWQLGRSGYLLSGEVGDVQRALAAWNVSTRRDERTGDITHPALMYLVDADGTLAYGATGGVAFMLELLRRL